MTATAEPSAEKVEAPRQGGLDRAEGIELLGPVHGSGYKEGAALVRRADGQVVQLGPLMYSLLENIDGRRTPAELAESLSDCVGRECDEEHVLALAQKLADQGLLAGTEHKAPPRRNPLLALRWKVLVTNPAITRRITAPFTFFFRPFVMWPLLACFVAVCWFVLIRKGVAGATAEAFHNPTLLLLVFVLAVLSAGFHELGHAAACRYGGGTPAGMGMGIYMVWPAFYTDVTDAYRLPRRDRLRVDLGGLYFNAVVAVATMGVWLLWHVDALLLLIALQLLQMVKQLSPIIRADGYHILADATGIPDLFAHIGPTLRRLIPGRRRDPSALTGRARFLVTAWVLVVVPVLLSMMIGAVILLPRLMTSAWESGRAIVTDMPHEGAFGVLASLVRLLALALPVLGCILVSQKLVRTLIQKGEAWSAGRPVLRAGLIALATAGVAGAAWALWPAGQYQPVRASDRGTLTALGTAVASPTRVVRPTVPILQPGTYLAASLVPVNGASTKYPAYFVIPGKDGDPPVTVVSASAPPATDTPALGETPSPAPPSQPSDTTQAAAFPFTLPSAPGPGSTQAVAVGTKNGGVVYKVAYAVVTVSKGAPVTNTNSAFAFASCKGCTTVAVSFQLVLVVGASKIVAPINAAGALNVNCPACMTTAIADQIVTTLTAAPSQQLVQTLEAELKQLDALPSLGANGTPAAVAAQVAAVQQQVATTLAQSGLLPKSTSTTTSSTSTTTTTTTTTTTSTTTTQTTTNATTTTTGAVTTTTPTTTSTPSG